MRFENQAVLVSGAGRGIGREIALGFAREGADIGFADINEETARSTIEEIKKAGPPRVLQPRRRERSCSSAAVRRGRSA